MRRLAALAVLILTAAGCASSASNTPGTTATSGTNASTTPKARPQAVEPMPGSEGVVVSGSDPVGDVNAHAPPLSEVQKELKQELVAVKVSDASYINPLHYVTHWERPGPS